MCFCNILFPTGYLGTPIRYTFCEEQHAWYWSIDGFNWCHISRLVWPTGSNEGLVPSLEEQDFLEVSDNLAY